MTLYYFATSALPSLELGEAPDITFEEYMNLVHENLSAADLQKVYWIQGLVDLDNLAALWQGKPLDKRGRLSFVQLEEMEDLPAYMSDFLERFESNEDRLRNHGALTAQFFRYVADASSGFLRDYFEFERRWRLVMVALRAKQLGRDVAVELQHEDPYDELVASILAQKDAPSYEPPEGFEPLAEAFANHGSDPMELYRAVERFRYHWVDEQIENERFNLAVVLGYLIQLMTVERWQEMAA